MISDETIREVAAWSEYDKQQAREAEERDARIRRFANKVADDAIHIHRATWEGLSGLSLHSCITAAVVNALVDEEEGVSL